MKISRSQWYTPPHTSCLKSLHIIFNGNLSVCKTRRGNHKPILTKEEIISGGRLGMDSHADMSCVGAHASILEDYEGQLCKCNVIQ